MTEISLVITDIAPQRRRPGRVSVFINDEFLLGAEADAVLNLGWRPGLELSQEALQRAQEELEYRAARASAEVYLGYKARTEHEVLQKLQSKGYSPGAIRNALQHLQAQGYINDKEYASQYAATASSRKIGRRRVVADLRQRGMEAEIAGEAAGQIDDATETELALSFARSRAASMAQLEPVVRNRRLAAALQRRGFSYATLRAVLEHLETGTDTD